MKLNRPIVQNKKMAELSTTLYEQFAGLWAARREAEAGWLEATSKRNLEVLGYGE
jgi:hypothetical protein